MAVYIEIGSIKETGIMNSIKYLSGSTDWLHLSDEKHRLRQYYVLYTALFVLVCGIVFCWYFLTGRTFIWQDDGWSQHYKALVNALEPPGD